MFVYCELSGFSGVEVVDRVWGRSRFDGMKKEQSVVPAAPTLRPSAERLRPMDAAFLARVNAGPSGLWLPVMIEAVKLARVLKKTGSI